MRRVLCVHAPFCTPVSPPYSITYIKQFLEANTDASFEISLLDLNAWFVSESFKGEHVLIKDALKEKDANLYAKHVRKFKQQFMNFSREENKKLRLGEHDEKFDSCLHKILDQKPDVVLFSVVYNSQCFFVLELAKALKKKGIKVIVGGPAVSWQLRKEALYLPHEIALLEHLLDKKVDMNSLDCKRIVDYSSYTLSNYLATELVYPLRTTSACYYKKCTFCTHHGNVPYVEYALSDMKESLVRSKAKYVFITDDMVHTKRLLELGKMFASLNIKWMCQLRPMKDLDADTLRQLYDYGLRVVIWGVESASNRVLDLMKKGTNIQDARQVLVDSKNAGITNVTYIMFGFPTETKDEFLQTVNFLKENADYIDLVSTSVFGLQDDAPIMSNLSEYGISKVKRMKRTVLGDKISYDIDEGLSSEEAKTLRKKYAKSIQSVNSYPNEMNIYREHMLQWVSEE